MVNTMQKTFGAYIRDQRLRKGYRSGRAFAKLIGISPTLLSDIELGKKTALGETKIARIAEALALNKDELLAMNGKVSSDVIEIILQKPKEMGSLLRRLNHAPSAKINAYESPAVTKPDFYPLETISHENHTAVVGESGSGKSLLTKYLIHSYFQNAAVRVYDSDAAPGDWDDLEVIGKKGDYSAIAQGMQEDLEELQRRTERHGDGLDPGSEIVRVIEEYPSTAAELSELKGLGDITEDIGIQWLRKLLRRGRKYRMKVFAVAQEFEVNAWKIAGEGGLRRAFTVIYLGSTAYQALSLIKDKAHRGQLRQHFDSVPYPCLVDVKGRFYPARIPDLSGFSQAA
jgi:transcriptional regulator with XRE-family HTH domain/GTPase SAR1 family protein